MRAYLIASSIPSIPRLPKPPGTRIPLTSPRISSTLSAVTSQNLPLDIDSSAAENSTMFECFYNTDIAS